MRIVALAGGYGGARFLRGLRHRLQTTASVGDQPTHITVIANTGDDAWFFGLKVCPDLDTLMYTLGDGVDEERGWGRREESYRVLAELGTYEAEPRWFTLGDRDLATHLIRTQLLTRGASLSEVTARLCTRWLPEAATQSGVTVHLLPMTDQRVETHVLVAAGDLPAPAGSGDVAAGDLPAPAGSGDVALHFQEWWVRHRARIPARGFRQVGAEQCQPAPGVLAAIAEADVVLLPPSNPVVSIGAILSVPGIGQALQSTRAPVVGVSPIIGDRPVRGMADACLTAIGVPTSARGVAAHYGARNGSGPGLLDGWLVDTEDGAAVAPLTAAGIRTRALDLYLRDVENAARIAAAALDLAAEVTGDRPAPGAPSAR
ncbi:MAG: 2-phospho-L-lactate transferase [Actinomycetales bacterium]|nr:2-phospho-L-lactate transferase [Actinomycetales bacterium]